MLSFFITLARLNKLESRSSAGQSATLIMQRSAVRACPRLHIKTKYYLKFYLIEVVKEILDVEILKTKESHLLGLLPLMGDQLSWLERLICIQEVIGSTPIFSTRYHLQAQSLQVYESYLFKQMIRQKFIDILVK